MNWRDEVEKRKDEMITELKNFLAIESVLDESTAGVNAPFGAKISEALDYMLNLGQKDGFITKNINGYAGHIEWGSGEGLIGILAHIDVVPAGDGWSSPPFAPEIREGKLFARGAIDDKGPAMAAYFALKIVKELGLPLTKRARLILGADEESQWRCMKEYFQHEEMPMMGFTPDADFPMITAEKGLMDIKCVGESVAEEAQSDWVLLQFEAGQRTNVVPDYAMAKLAGDGDVFELKENVQAFLLSHQIQGYAEEANEDVTIVFKGKSCHGSEPDKGLNAALELARFIESLSLDQSGSNYIRMVNQLLVDSLYGEKLSIAQEDDIVGKLTVNAGVFRYTRGGEALIDLNVRYPISGDGEAIIQTVGTKVAEYGLQITEVDHKMAHFCPHEHPLVSTLSKVYEEQTGEKAKLLSTGGGTYARSLDVGVAFGPLFPGDEETYHQKDEFIEVEQLMRATAIYAQAIYELAK